MIRMFLKENDFGKRSYPFGYTSHFLSNEGVLTFRGVHDMCMETLKTEKTKGRK